MTATEVFLIVSTMLGGLALFLFGMDTMSDSLSRMTGGILDKAVGFITKNRFTAFLFGLGLTSIVQSSSAVSVLTVGLVNSGIIGLNNAVGLLMGANLGTTVTAWLLSLNAIKGDSLLLTIVKPSSFSPFLAIVGVGMTMFARSERRKTIGRAILGFGIIMIGMGLMSDSVAPLKDSPTLENLLAGASNPLIAFLASLLVTMIIQSSDATVGMLQALAINVGITYGIAIPIICGAQIGTCITALLSSLGTSNNGKRTAFLNLYYNLCKTIPFLIIFYGLSTAMHFSFLTSHVGGVGIPFCHSLINILALMVWLPCAKFIVFLASRTIPFSAAEKEEQASQLTMLEPLLLKTPNYAAEQAERAVSILAETVGEAFEALIRFDGEGAKKVPVLCLRTQRYRDQIEKYLVAISAESLDEETSQKIGFLSVVSQAFGNIGGLTGRIQDIRNEMEGDRGLTDGDWTELRIFGEAVNEILTVTIAGVEQKKVPLSALIEIYQEEITRMSDQIKLRRLRRIHEEEPRRALTTLSLDVFYAEEKLLDHCDAVADAINRYAPQNDERPALSAEEAQKRRAQVRELFQDKYGMLQLED